MEVSVLDSSALLTAIHGETGADVVRSALVSTVMSTVNLAEVQTRLVRGGMVPATAWHLATSAVGAFLPFDEEQARLCGDLVISTRGAGLSAGDRSCLALAMLLGLPVYTADRQWMQLSLGVEIRLIR